MAEMTFSFVVVTRQGLQATMFSHPFIFHSYFISFMLAERLEGNFFKTACSEQIETGTWSFGWTVPKPSMRERVISPQYTGKGVDMRNSPEESQLKTSIQVVPLLLVFFVWVFSFFPLFLKRETDPGACAVYSPSLRAYKYFGSMRPAIERPDRPLWAGADDKIYASRASCRGRGFP